MERSHRQLRDRIGPVQGRRDVDRETLRAAMSEANTPVLLMVLVQLTGDVRWLQNPYRPTRTRGMSDHRDGGLPQGIQDEIRAAALEAVLEEAAGRPARDRGSRRCPLRGDDERVHGRRGAYRVRPHDG